MDQEEADVKHKFLLIFGSNQKRTDIIGPASGVGKSKILTALLKTFGQNELDGDIQVYDKDFDDYADIEECDLVTGPAKVRLTTTPQQDAVQVLPVKLGMADNVTTICTGEKPGLTKEQMNVLATFMDDVGSNIGVSAGPFRTRSSPSPSLSQPASGPPSTLRAAGGPPSTSQTAGGPPSTLQAAGVPPSPSQAAGGPPSPSQAAAGPPSPSQGAGGPPSTSQAAGGPLSPSQSPTPLTGSWNNFSIPPQTPTIEMKLVNGGDSMTETERSLFLDTIYNEVAQKCGLYYPTKTNYDTMIGKIHRMYPKMMAQTPSMSSGNKKLLWKHRLIYKFQNRRRRTDQDLAVVQNRRLNPDRKPRSEQRQARNIRPQWGMSNYLPPREPTEDDTTVASHIKWLATEKRKRQPDFKMVHCCMNKTLADRRKWVVNETPSVSDVQEKYPWLFDEDELLREMNRIRGDDTRMRRELLAGLKKYSTGLVHKGKACKQMHPYFSAAVAELDSSDDVTPDAVAIAAFLAIPGLLQEQVGQIIVAGSDETTCPVYIKLDAETPRAATRYTLFADGVEVASTEDCLTAVAMWVSTFYVFNMTYPQCATRSLEFVQRVILNITDEMPPSRAILRLTNQLNAFSS